MNDDIKKMLERQDSWQKARKTEPWIEKLAKSAAARKSLATYPGWGSKKDTNADDSRSLLDINQAIK